MSREQHTLDRALTLQDAWQEVTERSWTARGLERIRLRERAAALRQAFLLEYQRACGALSAYSAG